MNVFCVWAWCSSSRCNVMIVFQLECPFPKTKKNNKLHFLDDQTFEYVLKWKKFLVVKPSFLSFSNQLFAVGINYKVTLQTHISRQKFLKQIVERGCYFNVMWKVPNQPKIICLTSFTRKFGRYKLKSFGFLGHFSAALILFLVIIAKITKLF